MSEEPQAWLALAELQETPQEKTAFLRQVAERFPADAQVVETATRQLRAWGNEQAAAALAESFLERHPEKAEAWRLVVAERYLQGSGERARQALAGWLERFPGDVRAAAVWLAEESRRAGPEETRRMAEAAVARMDVAPEAVYFCERLSSFGSGDLLQTAVGCYARVLAASLPAEARQYALASYAAAMARLGNWEDLDRAVAALPAPERPAAVLSAALSLQNKVPLTAQGG